MSLVLGSGPTNFNSYPTSQNSQTEPANDEANAQSNPTPTNTASASENDPVTASGPTQDNANSANNTAPASTFVVAKSDTPAAEPESILRAQTDGQATATLDMQQARQNAQAAQVAYAQQAIIDRLDAGPSNTTADLFEAKSTDPSAADDAPGASLSDIGEVEAADAEDPLAA